MEHRISRFDAHPVGNPHSTDSTFHLAGRPVRHSNGKSYARPVMGEREDGPTWTDGLQHKGRHDDLGEGGTCRRCQRLEPGQRRHARAKGRLLAKGYTLPDGSVIWYAAEWDSPHFVEAAKRRMALDGINGVLSDKPVRRTALDRVNLVDQSAALIEKRQRWLSEINRPSSRSKVNNAQRAEALGTGEFRYAAQ